MNQDTRAYVALVAGQLISKQQAEAILDKDRECQLATEQMRYGEVNPTGANRTCQVVRDPEADNFCLINQGGKQHICLSLYGKLFEGYDRHTASHFNGFVDDETISLYDFSESDFFIYELN